MLGALDFAVARATADTDARSAPARRPWACDDGARRMAEGLPLSVSLNSRRTRDETPQTLGEIQRQHVVG